MSILRDQEQFYMNLLAKSDAEVGFPDDGFHL